MSKLNMGIGKIGDSPIISKGRKWRYMFEIELHDKKAGPFYVKLNIRPSILKKEGTLITTFTDYGDDELKPLYNTLGKGILTLYDGCGIPLEKWILNDLHPQSINFGDLVYTSDPTTEVEITWHYSEVIYENLCSMPPICTTPPVVANQVKIEDIPNC